MRNKLSKAIKTCEKGISSSFPMIGSRIQDKHDLIVGENKYLTY